MERMSTLDAGFFYVEHENVPMHIGSLALFEGPAPAYDDLGSRARRRARGARPGGRPRAKARAPASARESRPGERRGAVTTRVCGDN